MYPFVLSFIGVVALCVPILFTHETSRKIVRSEDVERVQAAVPVEEQQSVIVYGDSRGAFFGDGVQLVPGWAPVVNEGREGCSFLGQDHIWVQYGKEGPRERNTSKQSTGETVSCDTRTYIPSAERYDIAIIYAGTLFTVNSGTTSAVLSPTDGFMNPEHVGQWAYLFDNFVETLSRINADRIVILGTPVSTNTWDAIGDPFWDDMERIMAVNSMLYTAANRVGATYVNGFVEWVHAQPASCQPDGSHMTIECARAAGAWVKAALESPPTLVATATLPAKRLP